MEQILQNFIDGLPWQSTAWVAWAALFGLIAVCLAGSFGEGRVIVPDMEYALEKGDL